MGTKINITELIRIMDNRRTTVWDRYYSDDDNDYICKDCKEPVEFVCIWHLIYHKCK